MATRRRRHRPAKRRRRNPMASVRRRSGASISKKAWRASGYRRNPRRRVHHRVRHRRNPMGLTGIGGQVFTLAKDATAVMAGGAAGRFVSNLIPFGGSTPVVNAGKGVLVAIAFKKLLPRVVSSDLAHMMAIGALLNPLRDLILSVAPQAGQFLSGGYALPTWPGGRMGTYAAYAAVRGGAAEGADTYQQVGEGMGAYADPWQS